MVLCRWFTVVDVVVALVCQQNCSDRSIECTLRSRTGWYEMTPLGYTDWLFAAFLCCPSCSDLLKLMRQFPCQRIDQVHIPQMRLLDNVSSCTFCASVFTREPLLPFFVVPSFLPTISNYGSQVSLYVYMFLRAYNSSYLVWNISHINLHVAFPDTAVIFIRGIWYHRAVFFLDLTPVCVL